MSASTTSETAAAPVPNGKHRATASKAPAKRGRPPTVALAPNTQAKPAPLKSVRPQLPVGAAISARSVPVDENPLVHGLFATFPPDGAKIAEVKAWLDTAHAVLKQCCRYTGEITIVVEKGAT